MKRAIALRTAVLSHIKMRPFHMRIMMLNREEDLAALGTRKPTAVHSVLLKHVLLSRGTCRESFRTFTTPIQLDLLMVDLDVLI